MPHTQNNGLTLVRIFDATIGDVWKAWTNPQEFAKWYGSPGKLVDIKIDLRVGGEWEATTVLADKTKYPAISIYRVIKKPHTLVFDYLNTENKKDPNFETMTIHLKDLIEKTEMTFNQKGHLSEEEYLVGLKNGWTGFFDKLEEIIT